MNIVLLEPEIPANTGNIGRTCVATGTRLHLIEPLGFKISEKAVVLNVPINLRAFFGSETMSNFFAVTVIDYLFDHQGCTFEEVLNAVAVQMDEKIEKEKLAETISYNVSNEKKWYVRATPLLIKKMALSFVFMRSSRSHTLTLSNLGPIQVKTEYEADILGFLVIIGVSRRQKMKCAVCAYQNELVFTFNSIFRDEKLAKYFFDYLEREGVPVRQESNGSADTEHDLGNYPKVSYNPDQFKKLLHVFYLVLFAVAAILGVVNLLTFKHTWWSWIAIASIFYVIMTVRYSLTRRANLASKLVIQSIGVQVLLVIIDGVNGYSGWSVNYAIPSVLLFDVLAVVGLIIVNRLNWQSYFMYQIALTIFSFIPICLWAVGLVDKPVMAIITVIISVSILVVTFLLGDRGVKKELIRRFHL